MDKMLEALSPTELAPTRPAKDIRYNVTFYRQPSCR